MHFTSALANNIMHISSSNTTLKVAVWNSGILLLRLLDKLSISNPSIFKDKSMLELGCGVALSSIACAKFGASSVLATDANPEVLDLAKRNIERNNAASVVNAVALQWGLLDATEYESSADIVVGSDLTYNSGSWVQLAETMDTVLKPEGIVIYLVGFDVIIFLPGLMVGGANS